MEAWPLLWARALRPRQGFLDRAAQAPTMKEALRGLLLLRAPCAFLELALGYWSFAALYEKLASPESGFWERVLAQLPEHVDPGELKEALARLPVLPSLHSALPWLLLLAPVVVLSVWLHDAAFDHAGLWLLGGLRTRRGFRTTLVADAEALKVGVWGVVPGLLAYTPEIGWLFGLLLLPLGIYFWIMRGYALAAWHGCPPWKGVVATLLHVVLVGGMLIVFLMACLLMVVLLV